jgi:hypothetical protein
MPVRRRQATVPADRRAAMVSVLVGAMREAARLRIKSERPNLFPSAALPIRHLRSLSSTVKR